MYKQGQESYLEISGNSSVQLEVTGEIELGVYISDEEKEGLERTLGDYSKEELNEIGIDETSQKLLNREVVSQEGTEAINSQRSVSNDKLELFTELNNNDIIDGTPDFDDNDEPGNDSGASNGIVRSFDTITYPLKMTVNSKTGNTINNIKVEISGELENGVYKDRVQAVFSEGANKEPLKDGKSTFKTEYTIPATGNAITFPLTVEVLGAFNGINLTLKNLKVNVISMNGEAVEGLEDTISNVKSIKTSSKVNIDVILPDEFNNAVNDVSLYLPELKENPLYDNNKLVRTGLTIVAVPLDGKVTVKGSSFPTGKINFHMVPTKKVVYDNGEEVNINLTAKNFKLWSYFPVENKGNNFEVPPLGEGSIAFENGYSVSFEGGNPLNNAAGSFSLTGSSNYVMNSGKYLLDSKKSNELIKYFTIENYSIGSEFPTMAIGGLAMYSINEKAISTQGFGILLSRDFVYDTRANTEIYNLRVVLDSYFDEKGEEHKVEKYKDIKRMWKNDPNRGSMVLGTQFTNKTGQIGESKNNYTIGVRSASTPFGDSQVITNSIVYARATLEQSCNSFGSKTLITVWNTDSFEFEQSDNSVGYWIWDNETQKHVKTEMFYGVSKQENDNSFEKLKSFTEDSYYWYKNVQDALKKGKIGAVMGKDIPREILNGSLDIGYTAYQNRIPLKVITKNIGSVNDKGTPNIVISNAWVGKDDKDKEIINFDGEKITDYTKYSNGKLESYQIPVGHSNVRFDTLGVIENEVRNEISSKKKTYYSTDKVNYTITSTLKSDKKIENDTDVFWEITIPKGLILDIDSFYYGDTKVTPKVTIDEDGTSKVKYYRAIHKDEEIKKINYTTSILAIDVDWEKDVATLNTESIISSPTDSSNVQLRTTSCDIVVTKVGQLGIAQEISKPIVEINEEFKVTLKPYTTSEKESGFTGIWKLPETNDEIGNIFNGTLEMKEIETFGKEIEVYVSKDKVTETNPNKIEGNNQIKLEKYVKGQNLSGYKTVFYKLKEDLLGNDKETSVQITLQPSNNVGGNVYRFVTYGNSASDYKVEAESNRVGATVYERKVNGYAWLGKKDTGIYVKDKDYLLDNISVKLFKKGSEGYKEVSGKTTKTNVNGYYELNNLQSGEYAVGFKEVDISKYKLQKALVGEDSSVNSKVSGNDKVAGYVLTEEFTLPDIANMEEALYIQPYENIGVYGIPSVVISKQVLNEENEDILGKEVETNSTIRYKLNYQNTVENSFVENAVISDTLAEHLSYKGNMKIDGVAVDESKVKVTGQKIEVQVGDIEDTKTHSIVFDVEVGREIAETFENEFTLTSENLEKVVSNKVENTVSPSPELIKEVDKEKVKIGEDLEYVITVKNKENSGVWNQVVLKDIFVDSQNQEVDIESFEKAVIRKGDIDENWDKTEVEYNEDNTTYSVNIGDLYEGDVVKVRFKAKVKNYSERYINEAIAEGINGTSNRDDTEVLSDYETPVMPVIVKQGNKEKVSVGEGVVYNVRVGNDGVDTWREVKVRDNYDSGMDYKDGTLKVYREKDGVKELDEELSKDGDSYVDKKNREILVEVGDIKNDEVVELEYELQAIEEKEKYDNIAVGEGINGISKLVEVEVVQQEEEDVIEEPESYEQSSLGTEEKNNREQANLPKTSNELSGISIVVFSIITLFCGVVSAGRTKKE